MKGFFAFVLITSIAVVEGIAYPHLWPLGDTTCAYDVASRMDALCPSLSQCGAIGDAHPSLNYRGLRLDGGPNSFIDLYVNQTIPTTNDFVLAVYIKPSTLAGVVLDFWGQPCGSCLDRLTVTLTPAGKLQIYACANGQCVNTTTTDSSSFVAGTWQLLMLGVPEKNDLSQAYIAIGSNKQFTQSLGLNAPTPRFGVPGTLRVGAGFSGSNVFSGHVTCAYVATGTSRQLDPGALSPCQSFAPPSATPSLDVSTHPCGALPPENQESSTERPNPSTQMPDVSSSSLIASTASSAETMSSTVTVPTLSTTTTTALSSSGTATLTSLVSQTFQTASTENSVRSDPVTAVDATTHHALSPNEVTATLPVDVTLSKPVAPSTDVIQITTLGTSSSSNPVSGLQSTVESSFVDKFSSVYPTSSIDVFSTNDRPQGTSHFALSDILSSSIDRTPESTGDQSSSAVPYEDSLSSIDANFSKTVVFITDVTGSSAQDALTDNLSPTRTSESASVESSTDAPFEHYFTSSDEITATGVYPAFIPSTHLASGNLLEIATSADQVLVPSATEDISTTASVAAPENRAHPRRQCTCRCKSSLSQQVSKLVESLTVNKTALSASRRKRTSAPDSRKSAVVFGSAGVSIIVCFCLLLLLWDSSNFFIWWKRQQTLRKSDSFQTRQMPRL